MNGALILRAPPSLDPLPRLLLQADGKAAFSTCMAWNRSPPTPTGKLAFAPIGTWQGKPFGAIKTELVRSRPA